MADPKDLAAQLMGDPFEAAATRQRRGVVSPGRADTTIDKTLAELLVPWIGSAQAMDLSKLPESRNIQVAPDTQRFVGPTPTQLFDYRGMPVNQTPPPESMAAQLGFMDIPWPHQQMVLGTKP